MFLFGKQPNDLCVFFCSKKGLAVKSVHTLHNANIYQELFVSGNILSGCKINVAVVAPAQNPVN